MAALGAMFEDAQELVALKESAIPGVHGPRTIKLLMRCTANANSSMTEYTYVPDMCFNARGCCNTTRAQSENFAALDDPISSSTTLDVKARLPHGAQVVDE